MSSRFFSGFCRRPRTPRLLTGEPAIFLGGFHQRVPPTDFFSQDLKFPRWSRTQFLHMNQPLRTATPGQVTCSLDSPQIITEFGTPLGGGGRDRPDAGRRRRVAAVGIRRDRPRPALCHEAHFDARRQPSAASPRQFSQNPSPHGFLSIRVNNPDEGFLGDGE